MCDINPVTTCMVTSEICRTKFVEEGFVFNVIRENCMRHHIEDLSAAALLSSYALSWGMQEVSCIVINNMCIVD